jgi:hypothetical protein
MDGGGCALSHKRLHSITRLCGGIVPNEKETWIFSVGDKFFFSSCFVFYEKSGIFAADFNNQLLLLIIY